MKKVTTRAFAVLLLVVLTLAGTGVFIYRLAVDGGDWATFYANQSIYSEGVLNRGSVADRNGLVLATASDEGFHYADDADIRKACLHAVGDLGGNIGSSILSMYRADFVNYSFFTGTTAEAASMKLTLDADVCAAAYNAIAGKKGTVLVYNYRTGEIICMVSTPTWDPEYGVDFDPNNEAYEGAFINRALSSTFTPGSVFKLVTLAAALENIPDIWQQTFYCDGDTIIGGQRVKCSGVHGTITVEQALAHSCNCAFGEIAAQLGGALISQYAEKYGLTTSHMLNGKIPTAAGSVPAGRGEIGDAAWEGIGQYEDLINPYAFLRFIGAIANGGVCVEPTILYGESAGATQLMDPNTAQTLSEMMGYNVQYEYGAGTYPGLEMHAKTGTAETYGGTHAWFAGFITNANAPYAFVVMAERAGGGYYVASPIANATLQKAVQKANG